MQGFIQGSLWGLIVGGVGLGFVSLVNEQPEFAAGPPAPQLATPELGTVTSSPSVAVLVTPEATPSFTPAAPLEPVSETGEATPDVSTEPATPPQATDVATAIDAPEAGTEPETVGQVDEPVTGQVESGLAAAVPETSAPVVDTTPAEPSSDVAADETTETQDQPEVIVLDGRDSASDGTSDSDTASAPLIVITEAPETEPATPLIITQTPEPEPSQTEEVVQAEPEPEADPGPQEEVVAEAVIEAPAPTAPTPPEELPETGEPATVTPELPQTNAAVRINRLGVDEEAETEALVEDELPDDRPALLRFAAEFENPEALPLISVILIDTGEMAGAEAALTELGFVPTVAVNALSPQAGEDMTRYRAAGIEVAMQADLPDGAQPADVEVAFEAAFGILPEVAMLFSNGAGALQNRAVTSQVMDILAADGRGFVTVQRGLGNAARAAEQSGIPSATILRDLDDAGADSGAMMRALDQAAFRARQSGQAVLLGRMTPQTLDVLRDWASDLDRETLAIAPVSAILRSQIE